MTITKLEKKEPKIKCAFCYRAASVLLNYCCRLHTAIICPICGNIMYSWVIPTYDSFYNELNYGVNSVGVNQHIEYYCTNLHCKLMLLNPPSQYLTSILRNEKLWD